MTIDPISQVLLVAVASILALIVTYAFFDNNFNYLMYFEIIFITLFVAFNVLEFYYLAIVILAIAVIAYNAVAPELQRGEK